jgi:hypothetical protein
MGACTGEGGEEGGELMISQPRYYSRLICYINYTASPNHSCFAFMLLSNHSMCPQPRPTALLPLIQLTCVSLLPF